MSSYIKISALPPDDGGGHCQISVTIDNLPANVSFSFYKNGALLGTGTSVDICTTDGRYTFKAKGNAPDGSGYYSGSKTITLSGGRPNLISIPVTFTRVQKFGDLSITSNPTGKLVTITPDTIDAGNTTPDTVTETAPFVVTLPTGTYKVSAGSCATKSISVVENVQTDVFLNCTCKPCQSGVPVAQYAGLGPGDLIKANENDYQFLIMEDGKKHWVRNLFTKHALGLDDVPRHNLSLSEVNQWPTGYTVNFMGPTPCPPADIFGSCGGIGLSSMGGKLPMVGVISLFAVGIGLIAYNKLNEG